MLLLHVETVHVETEQPTDSVQIILAKLHK